MERKNYPRYYNYGGKRMNQDDLRGLIFKYIEKTGVKKKFIAQSIGENPNNFSRWLTGKRNYGPERKQQIIDFLIERGMLNG